MLKTLMLSVDGRMYNIAPKEESRVLRLSGDKEVVQTVISSLERLLAGDFTSYYDDFDKKAGVSYLSPIDSATATFDFGTYSFVRKNNSFTRTMSTRRDIHCLRYIGNKEIRSISLSAKDGDVPFNFHYTPVEYSSDFSISKWMRLTRVFNELVGYEAVSLNISKRTLDLNFKDTDSLSADAIGVMYSILLESMVSSTKGYRVTLLSELKCLSGNEGYLQKFITVLSQVGNCDTLIFSGDSTFKTLTSGERVDTVLLH